MGLSCTVVITLIKLDSLYHNTTLNKWENEGNFATRRENEICLRRIFILREMSCLL